MVEKVVLAYSGGLDTSVILAWLLEQGHEVVCFIADLGQPDDLEAAEAKAITLGASAVVVADVREEFITDFIFPALRANAAYEGRYLMGTSLARPLIARKQIEVAQNTGATALAHGATFKGNDQVRFELTYAALWPGVRVMAPWREPEFYQRFQGRQDLRAYARQKGIPIAATRQRPWSVDANLMHLSFESGELEDPGRRPRESMFQMTVSPRQAPNRETELEIEFTAGNPVAARDLTQGAAQDTPLGLFTYLNQVGGANAIGREDMVENRFVGIKSRGVYETPAGTILHRAHRDLEGITLDREVMHLRDSLTPRFAELVYYGLWYSPEMEVLRAFFDKAQEPVTGKVRLALYKGNIIITGRESPCSLYDQAQASMDVLGGLEPQDAGGFIRTHALRLANYALRKQRQS